MPFHYSEFFDDFQGEKCTKNLRGFWGGPIPISNWSSFRASLSSTWMSLPEMNFPLTTYIQWKWLKKFVSFTVLWKWLRHQTTLHWLFSHHMTKKLSSKSTPKWKETSWFPSFMLDKPIYFLPTNLKKFLYADYIFIQDFWVAIGKHFNFFIFSNFSNFFLQFNLEIQIARFGWNFWWSRPFRHRL